MASGNRTEPQGEESAPVTYCQRMSTAGCRAAPSPTSSSCRARRRTTPPAVLFDRPKLTETSRWYGDRPTLPDYLPIIGTAPNHHNVVLAFGHQHLGLSLAATTAELVTDVIQVRTPRLDITALSA